jgi:hypothetical protein
MGESDSTRKRQVFLWPKAAGELVRDYEESIGRNPEHNESDREALIARLAEISGNPRDACLRFLRHLGIPHKRSYREWTKPEQQRFSRPDHVHPREETANILHRSSGSVRSMLHRLGIGGRTGREGFTKFSLSRALHTAPTKSRNGSTLAG